MNKVLRKLAGNELKILLILLTECDAEYSFTPIEGLNEYGLTAPTVLKVISRLKRFGAIEQYDFGNRSMLKLKESFKGFSDYLKNYSFHIELTGSTLEDIEERKAKAVERAQVEKLIGYYAKQKGVPDEKVQSWNRMNFARLIKPARNILSFVGSLERSLTLVDNTKLYYESKGLDWTMGGVMLREISKLSNMAKSDDNGEKKWF